MRRAIDLFIERLLILLMSIMTLNVIWQVFSRYILNDPSSFTDELARYLLIWIGLIGAAYGTGKKLHLSISLIPHKLMTKKLDRFLTKLTYSLVGLFALFVMGFGGGRLVYITLYLGQKSPALEIPLGYIYLAIPISGLIILYYSILNIIAATKN